MRRSTRMRKAVIAVATLAGHHLDLVAARMVRRQEEEDGRPQILNLKDVGAAETRITLVQIVRNGKPSKQRMMGRSQRTMLARMKSP